MKEKEMKIKYLNNNCLPSFLVNKVVLRRTALRTRVGKIDGRKKFGYRSIEILDNLDIEGTVRV